MIQGKTTQRNMTQRNTTREKTIQRAMTHSQRKRSQRKTTLMAKTKRVMEIQPIWSDTSKEGNTSHVVWQGNGMPGLSREGSRYPLVLKAGRRESFDSVWQAG